MKKIYVYYHRDLDGKTAAAIAYRYFDEQQRVSNVVFRDINYGEDPNLPPPEQIERLIVLDYCFKNMEQYLREYKTTWIDHHKTSREIVNDLKESGEYEALQEKNDIVIEIGRAGCELAWDFFYSGQVMPELVSYAGRYDVWDRSDNEKWTKKYLPFQYACQMRDTNPASPFMQTVVKLYRSDDSNFYIDSLLKFGQDLVSYIENIDRKKIKRNSFVRKWHGLNVIFINDQKSGSTQFETINGHEDFDITSVFRFDGDKWTFSLYSAHAPRVDCSAIAKQYGGGGHVGAAGFTCDHETFNQIVTKEMK